MKNAINSLYLDRRLSVGKALTPQKEAMLFRTQELNYKWVTGGSP